MDKNPIKKIEEGIVAGCKCDDRKSQEELYHRYSKKMFGVCLRYSSDRASAEDILQEGFIRVYKGIRKFRHEGSLEGWIRRIMVNTAIEAYRKKARFQIMKDFEENFMEPSSDDIMNDLKMEDLLKLIQSLPTGFRTVFNLYAIEGYSHKEIAEQLGINEGTSKSQLARARKILIKKVEKRFGIKKKEYVDTRSD